MFWAHIAVSFFVPIFTHYKYTWSQMTSWGTLFALIFQALQNPVVVVAVLVSIWNCIIDPTTKGLSDSTLVLSKRNGPAASSPGQPEYSEPTSE